MKRFFLLIAVVFSAMLPMNCSMPQEEDLPNHPPEITDFSIAPGVIKINETTTVRCRATDADHDLLVYKWDSPLGTILGKDSVVTWVAPDFQCEVYIRCTVSDIHGDSAVDSALVTVLVDTSAGG